MHWNLLGILAILVIVVAGGRNLAEATAIRTVPEPAWKQAPICCPGCYIDNVESCCCELSKKADGPFLV
jgi:hypothetical protein